MHIRCPHCHNAIEIVEDASFRDVSCPSCGSHFNLVGSVAPTESGPTKARRIGHFELIEQLGFGHFGCVWKAKDTTLDRFVALKIPRNEQLDELEIDKFFREARAAAQLRHPHIAAVHEVGREGNTIFIASDYVDGATLGEWLDRRPLPPREAARLCVVIADALQAAHAAGVVHRDLKPGNIMMDLEGQPHIVDFGLAKRESGEITVTMDGVLLGTPAYMPPEQAAGQAHHADCRSDVYSLGVILFEILTGELPFRGEKRMLLVQIQRDEAPSPRKLNAHVPRDLETICLKCLEKSPHRRYQSAADLSGELNRFLQDKPIIARPVSQAARMWRWAKRNPTVAVLLCLIAGIAIGGPAAAIRQTALRLALERSIKARTEAQVLSLLNADIQTVPFILDSLAEDWESVIPRLQQMQATANLSDDQCLRIRLAFVRADTNQANDLADQLLTTKLANLPTIATALRPHRETVRVKLWDVLHDGSQSNERRFRAAVTAAFLDAESPEWTPADDTFLVSQFVATNPELQPTLRTVLSPRSECLVAALETVFVDDNAPPNQRLSAARALANFLAQDGPHLARLASMATSEQYDVLFAPLADLDSGTAHRALQELVAEQPARDLTEDQCVKLGKRRAGAAINLLRLGKIADCPTVFQIQDDPESLTQFVHLCRERGVGVNDLLKCLREFDDERSRFAVLLALGSYSLADVDRSLRLQLIADLTQTYRDDPSSAVHGASGWLLRQWGFDEEVLQVDQTPVPYDPTGRRQWFVLEVTSRTSSSEQSSAASRDDHSPMSDKIYFTFVVFPATEFTTRSPEEQKDGSSAAIQHRVKLTRPFAVSWQEVTWAQYDPFDDGNAHRSKETQFSRVLAPNSPVFGVHWYESVSYCRWLTTQSGKSDTDQCFADPAVVPKDNEGNPRRWLADMNRPGFRLLTEAEWECACRAGTRSAFSFGSDPTCLEYYARFQENSNKWSHAVGRLRPNLRGLFDMHGNVFEWCYDWYLSELPGEAVDPIGADGALYRVGRGGSWNGILSRCYSGFRGRDYSTNRGSYLGFRIGFTVLDPTAPTSVTGHP